MPKLYIYDNIIVKAS